MLQRIRQAETGQGQRLHQPPPGWSSTLVKRLRQERKLEGHDGCVNTVHFSPCGQLLVSGSDDMKIMFWDWHLGTRTLTFNSGHFNNVFQARIMPHSANGTVVTCAADGLVRVARIPQGSNGTTVETTRLACHRGRAHKLALEPDSPHCFLSCGEDGEVRHFDLRQPAASNRRLLACRASQRRLELNSVHCRPTSTQFCVGGGDPFVRVYDLRRVAPSCDPVAEPVQRLAPWHLRGRRSFVSITCAVYSQKGEVLASYNDENIYLFKADGQQEGRVPPVHAAAGRRSGHAAEQAPSQAPEQNGAGSSSRQRNKRLRSSGGGDSGSSSGLEREDAAQQQAAAAGASRARRQQRQAAAAAALEQRRAALAAAERDRAASQAAAAAASHAAIRRGLQDEELSRGGNSAPSMPPLAADAAAGGSSSLGGTSSSRQPDAAWLDRLRTPKADDTIGQQQQQQAPGGATAQVAEVPPERDMDMAAGSEELRGGRIEDSEAEDGGAESSSSASGAEDGGEAGQSEDEAQQLSVDVWGQEESGEDEGEEEEEFEDDGPLPQGALVDDADVAPHRRQAGQEGSEDGQHSDGVRQVYKGHRNYRTVKGVSFLGRDDEFVMSGSDCGHVFVWDASTGTVQAMLHGDQDTVNCLEPHPHHLLTIATSGIEDTIKLWAPTAEEPQVLGAAEQRRMAANQRAQGNERRMFISPEMLQLLLRARQMDALAGSDSEGEEEEEEEDEDEEGSDDGQRRPRHRADCTIS